MSKFRYLEKELLHGGVSDSSEEEEEEEEDNSTARTNLVHAGGPKKTRSSARFETLFSKYRNDGQSESESDDDSDGSQPEKPFAKRLGAEDDSDLSSPTEGDEELEEGGLSDDDEALAAELRKGPLGDISREIMGDGKVEFKCKICPKAVMKAESSVASHLKGQKHRKAFLRQKKADWTPEMIQAKREKNQRKRQKRVERKRIQDKKQGNAADGTIKRKRKRPRESEEASEDVGGVEKAEKSVSTGKTRSGAEKKVGKEGTGKSRLNPSNGKRRKSKDAAKGQEVEKEGDNEPQPHSIAHPPSNKKAKKQGKTQHSSKA